MPIIITLASSVLPQLLHRVVGLAFADESGHLMIIARMLHSFGIVDTLECKVMSFLFASDLGFNLDLTHAIIDTDCEMLIISKMILHSCSVVVLSSHS
jgi:hypothetical protein